ncbi:hypothetical protein CDL15_Pgr000295 [Punica granatum]|nr:hypothetical protein CDL15_Pgr000295 [Punica granatum]
MFDFGSSSKARGIESLPQLAIKELQSVCLSSQKGAFSSGLEAQERKGADHKAKNDILRLSLHFQARLGGFGFSVVAHKQ